MKTPRPHQLKGVEATWDLMCKDLKSKPVCVVPVAGGKSYMMAMMIEKCRAYCSNAKVLCISHVSELSLQVAEEIYELMPNLEIGFYSDKLKSKDISKDITLGTIQSLYKSADKFFGGFDMVLIDEAHTISNKDKSMYNKLFKTLLLKNPYMRIVGFTGTAFRSMKYNLIEEPQALFTHISYQVPMLELIQKGFLCEIVTPEFGVTTKLSTEGVAVRGGDYVESQLQKAVDKSELTTSCVREILEHGKTRKKGLIFASGIDHAMHIYEEFLAQGENSVAVITGKTETSLRNSIIDNFKVGRIKYLINVAVLTTGFNCPDIDMLAIMRPMRSPVLYVQVLGRGMRTANGKDNCLLLDFGRVVDELGPIDTLDARIGKKKASNSNSDAPMKICPECQSVNFAGVRKCHNCGFEFPESEKKSRLNDEASTSAVLSTQNKKNKRVHQYKIVAINYRKYKKDDNSKPVMKVSYITDKNKIIHEFACFEHEGLPLRIATQWFKGRFPNNEVPKTIDEALTYKYPKVTRADTIKEGNFNKVIKVYFD